MQKDEIFEQPIDEAEILEEIKEGKTFRLQHRRVFLTYKTHLDKAVFRDWLYTDFYIKPHEVFIAHETGVSNPTTPYDHSHVYIDWGKQFQSKSSRVFDYEGIHPHIRKILSKKFDGIWRYLCKEDKSLTHLLDRCEKVVPIAEMIWNCKTERDALRLAKKPSDALGILTLYNKREEVKMEAPDIELYDWQKELLSIVKGPVHDRKVFWYMDKVGGSGKSTFADWLEAKEGALIINQMGSERDSASLILGALESGWDSRIVVVNIQRSKVIGPPFYDSLECIKDGRVTTTKWQGKSKRFPKPHVVVFANIPPDRKCMSEDRWVLKDITPKRPDDLESLDVPAPCECTTGIVTCSCGKCFALAAQVLRQ